MDDFEAYGKYNSPLQELEAQLAQEQKRVKELLGEVIDLKEQLLQEMAKK